MKVRKKASPETASSEAESAMPEGRDAASSATVDRKAADRDVQCPAVCQETMGLAGRLAAAYAVTKCSTAAAIMKSNEVICEAMSMDEWRAQRSERLVWMEEQRRVAAELQQILSEHKTMVEVMKEAFAEERRHLDEQRKTMEEQQRVYAEANAAWDLEREEDVRRIAKTSAALTEYCVKCCARVTKPVKGVESVKEAKPVDEAESIVVHVVPSKEGVRTYADAVSEPPSGRAKTGKRVEGATPPGGAAMVSCLSCGERGHGHWTCFEKCMRVDCGVETRRGVGSGGAGMM